MSKKIRDERELQDYIDSEYAWRFSEIRHIYDAICSAAPNAEKTLIRAGIAILYAHWEGFVKCSCRAFLQLIVNRQVLNKNLKDCFFAISAKKELSEIVSSNKIDLNIKAINTIRSLENAEARFNYEQAIVTESNLRYDVFVRILTTIGMDYSKYSTKENFIDKELADRRNSVAHGDGLELDKSSYRTLHFNVIKLIRDVKSDIEKAFTFKDYLVS